MVSIRSHRLVSVKPRRASHALVVLAEDDDEIREALTAILRSDGYHVRCFPDGDEMVRYLGRCEEGGRLPDLIVMDHRMPGYSGIEILEGLGAAAWNVPVLMITAYGPEIEQMAMALGVRGVFQKPFDADDLRTAAFCVIDWDGVADAMNKPLPA